MSAPQTNIEKQKRKHKGPLIGMAIGVVFAVGMLALLIGYTADEAGAPDGAEIQIDGRTGAEVPADGS